MGGNMLEMLLPTAPGAITGLLILSVLMLETTGAGKETATPGPIRGEVRPPTMLIPPPDPTTWLPRFNVCVLSSVLPTTTGCVEPSGARLRPIIWLVIIAGELGPLLGMPVATLSIESDIGAELTPVPGADVGIADPDPTSACGPDMENARLTIGWDRMESGTCVCINGCCCTPMPSGIAGPIPWNNVAVGFMGEPTVPTTLVAARGICGRCCC